MKAVIYFTEVPQQYEHKNMEHMIGEKLLATGLYKEYGLKLAFEPRATGEHGKPFLTLQPKIHYNITHSGKYVMCIIADQEIGIDVQVHKKVNYERMLELGEDYSGAVWSRKPLELRWEHAEVQLP